MSGSRMKVLNKETGSLHFTNPYVRHTFIRDDNDFPLLTSKETVKHTVDSKHGKFTSGAPMAPMSYSAKLQVPQTSYENVFPKSEIETEKIRNINDYYFSNGMKPKQKQASQTTTNISSREARRSSLRLEDGYHRNQHRNTYSPISLKRQDHSQINNEGESKAHLSSTKARPPSLQLGNENCGTQHHNVYSPISLKRQTHSQINNEGESEANLSSQEVRPSSLRLENDNRGTQHRNIYSPILLKRQNHSQINNVGESESKFSSMKNKLNNNVADKNLEACTKPDSILFKKNIKMENTSDDIKFDPTKVLQLAQNSKSSSTNANSEDQHKAVVETIPKNKTKKNRKSKVKRHAAFQSGKILVLTTEAHSRILNKITENSSSVFLNPAVNFNDAEEYPELGQASSQKKCVNSNKTLTSKKGKQLNSINFCDKEPSENVNIVNEKQEPKQIATGVHQQNAPTSSGTLTGGAKKKSSEGETPLHPPASITIPFQDMLSAKCKKKEAKNTVVEPCDQLLDNTETIRTVKIKKTNCQPHNVLDSSSPAIKRGKERENPKPKRKSLLKKIILMDRQLRKEHHISASKQICTSDQIEILTESVDNEVKEEHEVQLLTEEPKVEPLSEEHEVQLLTEEHKVQLLTEVGDRIESSEISFTEIVEEVGKLKIDGSEDELVNDYNSKTAKEINLEKTENAYDSNNKDDKCFDEQSDHIITITKTENDKNMEISKDTDFEFREAIDPDSSYERSDSVSPNFISDHFQMNEDEENENDTVIESEYNEKELLPANVNEQDTNETLLVKDNQQKTNEPIVMDDDVEFCSDTHIESITNCSINESIDTKPVSAFSEVEKLQAAKIIIHSRAFRPYCTHLVSKEIGKAALALLDDLARFQDRLYHKNPLKARIKRRLVYGIREVMKNIKLKKLKCVLIAKDIENVEAVGGLNDAMAQLISLASDHHIPCVYAVGRKVLGKACHKPVPISCTGIFNYEGSEANFKKMIELQIQGQKDYKEVQEKVMEKLDDTNIRSILKIQKISPESIQNFRETIFGDIFKEKVKDAIQEDS